MARRNVESSRKDEFPIGMRVLAVDDDVVCLRLLEALLKQCGYRVTVAQRAITALELLRENKNNYDLVISDVHMPDMDGFKLLEIIGLEMDLPVIMLSINGETNYVIKGVLHGAVDYLVKPVRLEDLRLIWKHVINNSVQDKKEDNDHGYSNTEEKKADNSQYLSASSNCMDQTNEREDYANESSDGEISKHKKPRVSWSTDLHTRFIRAVNQLGLERAVPKRILELMNVQGITRENVASHLQKYRKTLKKNGLRLNQQYHAGPPVHSLRVNSPSSVIFSFNQQGRAKDSYRRDMPSTFHHCTFSQANTSTEYVGYSTNSFGLERAHASPRFNSFIHQPLTSTSDQVNAFAEKIHQNQWPSSGTSDPISSCQLQCTSNQDLFGIFFENNNSGFNDSAELNSALHYLDMTAQTCGDILNVQRYDADKPNDTCHREFSENRSEVSSLDRLFNLNRCHSADDLNTILKQSYALVSGMTLFFRKSFVTALESSTFFLTRQT